jgi:hypothetical protein
LNRRNKEPSPAPFTSMAADIAPTPTTSATLTTGEDFQVASDPSADSQQITAFLTANLVRSPPSAGTVSRRPRFINSVRENPLRFLDEFQGLRWSSVHSSGKIACGHLLFDSGSTGMGRISETELGNVRGFPPGLSSLSLVRGSPDEGLPTNRGENVRSKIWNDHVGLLHPTRQPTTRPDAAIPRRILGGQLDEALSSGCPVVVASHIATGANHRPGCRIPVSAITCLSIEATTD